MSVSKIRLIKKATIIPLIGSPSSFTGGVFTYDGQFIEDSLLERGRPAELQKPVEHLSDTYIYGGCFFGHFGHFIWESLSRLYTIRQCKNYPILFISSDDGYLDGYREFFKLLGINNEIHLVKLPTSVENLVYSHPGSTIAPPHITDEQMNALKYYYFNDKNSNEKIWLSRSKLLVGTIINESTIEKILAKIGYKIIHPEILSLQEQIRLISTSDIVAGFDGSQFYTVLFATEISGKFHIFNRRPKIPDAIPYVFQKKNIAFELHNFAVEYICGESAWSYYNHSEPEKIIEILQNL
jgi:hypothetical protein